MAVTNIATRRPPPPRDYGDPRTAHLRHHPMGLCHGCGVGSSPEHLIYTDPSSGHDWHADCYVTTMRLSPPRAWRLGRRVLPFTR